MYFPLKQVQSMVSMVYNKACAKAALHCTNRKVLCHTKDKFK